MVLPSVETAAQEVAKIAIPAVFQVLPPLVESNKATLAAAARIVFPLPDKETHDQYWLLFPNGCVSLQLTPASVDLYKRPPSTPANIMDPSEVRAPAYQLLFISPAGRVSCQVLGSHST